MTLKAPVTEYKAKKIVKNTINSNKNSIKLDNSIIISSKFINKLYDEIENKDIIVIVPKKFYSNFVLINKNRVNNSNKCQFHKIKVK